MNLVGPFSAGRGTAFFWGALVLFIASSSFCYTEADPNGPFGNRDEAVHSSLAARYGRIQTTSPLNTVIKKSAATVLPLSFPRPLKMLMAGPAKATPDKTKSSSDILGGHYSPSHRGEAFGADIDERPHFRDLSQVKLNKLLNTVLQEHSQIAKGCSEEERRREPQTITDIMTKFRDEPEKHSFLRSLQDEIRARDAENERPWVVQHTFFVGGNVPQVPAELGQLLNSQFATQRCTYLQSAMQAESLVNRLVDQCTLAVMHIDEADLQHKEFNRLKGRILVELTSVIREGLRANRSSERAVAEERLVQIWNMVWRRNLA